MTLDQEEINLRDIHGDWSSFVDTITTLMNDEKWIRTVINTYPYLAILISTYEGQEDYIRRMLEELENEQTSS